MAMNYQNFASLGVNLNRQKYGPLDISNVFTSAADLKYYLTKGTYTEGVSTYWYKNANEKVVPYPYEGQVLATVIDGVVEVFVLALDAEGNFETREIAGKIEVDGTTIVKDAEGKLSIVAPVNPDTTKTYNFSYANGVYSWVEVDTATAAGQAQAIQGLTDRTTAIENTLNGTGEGEEHVAGLVEKVAANTQAIADEVAAREAAIGKATEGDVAATGVYAAIEAAEARAKAYADANDADTIYDDTDLQTRVKALEDEERYDDTALSNRVTALEDVVGDAEDGLVKGLADEIARAKEAERVLDEAIKAIDFVDADELADAIKDFATTSYVDGEIDKIEEAISNLNHFTTKVVSSTDEVTETGVLYLIAVEGAAGVDKYNEYLFIDGEAVLIGDTTTDLSNYYDKNQIDSKVEALEDAIADEADARGTLAGRVTDLESKPFDTYATKTEVETVDGKFANYTTTEALNGLLADKANAADVVANDTFETFKTENDQAIADARANAVADVEAKGYAVASDVASTYATKDELTEAVEGIENDLLAYAKTEDVNAELAKKIETGSIAHSSESLAEGVTVEGTKLNIVVDAYTKQEVRDYVADVIEDMTGGESAADVLLALNNHITTYTEKVGQIDAKDAAQDTAIATAQTQADKGVADAAKVAADLVTANLAIAENTREIGVAKSSIETVNTTLTGKITALENADTTIKSDITSLQGIVSGTDGHASRIAALEGRAANLEAKDTELAGQISDVDAKFANYYTSTQVDAKIKEVADVVDAIDLEPYAKTADVNAALDLKANATDLANYYTKTEADAEFMTQTEVDDRINALIVGADPEGGKTIENIQNLVKYVDENAGEIASLITTVGNHTTAIEKNASDISKINNDIAALIQPKASSEISVATDGTLGIIEVNVNKLVQTEGDEFIINGGNA